MYSIQDAITDFSTGLTAVLRSRLGVKTVPDAMSELNGMKDNPDYSHVSAYQFAQRLVDRISELKPSSTEVSIACLFLMSGLDSDIPTTLVNVAFAATSETDVVDFARIASSTIYSLSGMVVPTVK